MKRVKVTIGLVLFLLPTKSHAQSGDVAPPADAAHAPQDSCVILKRMGPIGRTESRLYHFGISGKQFRYVEGKLPEGFSSHGKMTDRDVRNLQAHGAQVLVLDSHYTSEDLSEARADCQGQTSNAVNQTEAKATSDPAAPASVASTPAPTSMAAVPKTPTANAPAPASEAVVSAPAPAPKPSTMSAATPNAPAAKTLTPKAPHSASTGATEAALLNVSSTPAEAEVYVDERFIGSTPSTTIILTPGNHKIVLRKDGFVVWKKKLKLASGPTNVNAQLASKTK